MISGTRNPLYLALEWATLDQLSNGRTILGTGMGNPEEGVRREYAALGMDFEKRAKIFEEGLGVLRELWTDGKTNFHGDHFQYDDVSFYRGTEMAPLMPVQTPPPIWVVSQPATDGRHQSRGQDEPADQQGGCRRIAELRRRLDDLLPRPPSRGVRPISWRRFTPRSTNAAAVATNS